MLNYIKQAQTWVDLRIKGTEQSRPHWRHRERFHAAFKGRTQKYLLKTNETRAVTKQHDFLSEAHSKLLALDHCWQQRKENNYLWNNRNRSPSTRKWWNLQRLWWTSASSDLELETCFITLYIFIYTLLLKLSKTLTSAGAHHTTRRWMMAFFLLFWNASKKRQEKAAKRQ